LEQESIEYGACTFSLNSSKVGFRIAKITPVKIGHFVTIWKRIGDGPIQPYDIQDSIEKFIISVRDGDNFGQFVFPKQVLYQHKIFADNGLGGKRGIRVYPPWALPDSRQAQKTQIWQLNYFLDASRGSLINYDRVKMLYI
jgi:hypothetical protein